MKMEIVLNEKEWVEEKIKEYTLGKHPRITLARYAVLLNSRGYSKPEIRRALEDYIIRCDKNANILSWDGIISQVVRDSGTRSLFNIPGIPITSDEINAVQMVDGNMRRKVLFTLLCLAKYRNAIKPSNNNWVSYDMADVFRLANVSMSRKRQMMLLHNLCERGVLAHNRIVDNTNVRVLIVSDTGECAVTITDFRNLGNQYMNMVSDDYIECSECGAVVRKNNNRQKLCRNCAEEANRIETLRRYYDHIA